MNMRALWLTTLETPWAPVVASDWPRFDKVEKIDWSQALGRLRGAAPAIDTTWLLQWGAQGPAPEDLQQALQGMGQHLKVLVLLPVARQSETPAWLNAGVDRCMPWPCHPILLAAMLRALLRQSQPSERRVSQFGALRFDHHAMTLFCDDHRIALTQREAEVMSLLIRRVGQWVTNREILLHIAKDGACVLQPAAVQLYVHRINRKIAPHGLHVDCVKRVGYGLRVQHPPTQDALSAAWDVHMPSAHRPFASSWVQTNALTVSR